MKSKLLHPELTEFNRTALSMLNQLEPDSPEGRRWDILKNTSELFKNLLAQFWRLWENQPNEVNQKNLLEQIIDTERLLKQHKL